jgi:hypothetical protein
VAEARERLRLARDDLRLEPDRAQARLGPLHAQEREEAEHEPPAGHQVLPRLADEPVEQRPAVGAAVVRGCLGVVAVPAGRRRHLGRAGADQVEARFPHGREAIAQADVDPHRVARRVLAGAGHRLRAHVGGDHVGARARGQHRGQARAAADLQHALVTLRAEVAAEEQRARLGRLDPRADGKGAARVDEEELPVVPAHVNVARPRARRARRRRGSR